jgi:hypothetical protein
VPGMPPGLGARACGFPGARPCCSAALRSTALLCDGLCPARALPLGAAPSVEGAPWASPCPGLWTWVCLWAAPSLCAPAMCPATLARPCARGVRGRTGRGRTARRGTEGRGQRADGRRAERQRLGHRPRAKAGRHRWRPPARDRHPRRGAQRGARLLRRTALHLRRRLGAGAESGRGADSQAGTWQTLGHSGWHLTDAQAGI